MKLIKRITLECDYCDIEYEPDIDEDSTEEEVMEQAYSQDWVMVRSWFGERTYCTLDCFRNGFSI